MKRNEADITNAVYMITVGCRRQRDDLFDPSDSTELYLVYAGLVGGSDYIFAYDCSEGEALSTVGFIVESCRGSGMDFVLTEGGEYVLLDKVVRMYLDTGNEGHVAMAETVNSSSYTIAKGSETDCINAIRRAAQGKLLPITH